MWDEILATIGEEFSDLSIQHATQLTVRLLVAAFLGGILGWERAQSGKAAGLRTHVLVALGAAAFVAIPQQAGVTSDGIARILQGLVAGIGFLGAGCIMKQDKENHVRGLTTAAGIWLTAGVGVAAGLGREASALLLAGFGWFTLAALGRWERRSNPPAPQIKL